MKTVALTMARRPTHAPGELREMILAEATRLIEEHGLAGLSAREIAKGISYSPGTIYNAFENLDDVILTIEARLLDKLDAHLKEIPAQDGSKDPHVVRMAMAYLAFTRENRKLWNLLFEHYLAADKAPDWYQSKLDGLMSNIESALFASMPRASAPEIKRSARVLWAGVHGITSLAAADKLANVTTDTAQEMVRNLVETYLAGLNCEEANLRKAS